ncbi:MAG: BREX-6 system phosphatase PglZ [Phormidesmis sp.]
MPTLGPITTTLEAEVSSRLRQQSLIIWLDKEGHYTDYVDQLAERHAKGDFFAPVVAFRGSYLEMMLALEPYGNRAAPDLLLIHMPGHNHSTVRQTPILELSRAGKSYQRALDSLIREAATGKVNPDQIDGYLNHGATSLAEAEQWLETALHQPTSDLSQTLVDLKDLTYILDELLDPRPSFKQKFEGKNIQTLAEHLYRYTGMDDEFIAFYLQAPNYSFTELGETFCAWLMCVEYVHDLKREPEMPALKRLSGLSKPLVAEGDRLINHLRDRSPDRYETIAKSAEDRLSTEFQSLRPEDLGSIDTFRKEETTVLEQGALEALQHHHWQQALDWANSRLKSPSLWLQRDPKRRIEWTLIQAMAHLGATLAQVDKALTPSQTLREALETYTTSGYSVDLAHRQLEQQRSQLLESTLPHFNPLLRCADLLRQTYRDWANRWAATFASICETDSFLPEASLQQRTLYQDLVHPILQGNGSSSGSSKAKVAYFLVDAFRYEMATELAGELKTAGSTVHLQARYAELPTLTAVGMNALAPVQTGGRLTLAKGEFSGFRAGEYTVNTPASRLRAMSDRSINSTGHRSQLLTLSEVCEKSTKSLKSTLAKINLLVVHSKEIDDAGEANVGIVTFERWLQQLKSAWNHLKALGFNEFVFTADHGFLLQDKASVEHIKWGKATDPKRRHVLLKDARREAGLVTVSLNALGYDGESGYLHFSTTTNPFATGKPGATFVHGGNSLQERVIPVLTVSHRHHNTLSLVKYKIEAEAKAAIAGYSRLQVKVKPAATPQGVLSFTGAKAVNLSVRVPNRPDINVKIAEAAGALLKNQQIQVAVEQDWAEVLFNLVGPRDERVKIEVFQSDSAEDVEPTLIDTYFEVSGSKALAEDEESSTAPLGSSGDWQNSFEDEAIGKVFVHIDCHDVITETELTALLGSPRQARRFAIQFETYLQKVPFSVRVDSTASGKRYVKDLKEPEDEDI